MPSERVQRDIERLLDAASDALVSSEWQSAFESAEVALGLDPDNTDARSYVEAARRGLNAQPSESSPSEVPSTPPTPSPPGGEGGGEGASKSTTELPSSFANGRYEVKSLLGEGGKKKVYLAHDTTLDRDVAFGLIKAEGLDADSRQRITREAQAMARLGDHPNLMPIFDLGDENGQPFMVQPLMVGGDVEALIAQSDDGQLSLEDSLRIAGEICQGLEFAHGKGIIHRDLKPGNVWLTDSGTARIGDFGLALSLDRSRLTQEKAMVGTVAYMPPEQATGGEVTERADLYSLGSVLYEMVTGRPPFMGDDDIAIIGQHINTPPVAPSWHNQSLPQTLDSLIMRLLSKDPSERPGSATELIRALDAVDLTSATSVHEEEQGSLDGMSGGVFVGRHREIDQLKARFEETLGGHGKMAALVGEPGIGKTRTAQELATYASMRGGQVLWGRCYEGGGAPPYWPWVQVIRSYVLDRDAEIVRSEMGSTASVISEIVPDVRERLPDLHPPSQIDDPESARFRLFDSIATFLKTASNVQPIVLMLEDLHWSDKPSLMLLEFVARELTNSRLMIVGNYRDMELNRRHPLSITLGELSREHLFDRVLLRGLQRSDIGRFIEVAAGIDPPRPLVDAVFTQTEGNPLFLTETVRLLIQEGDITSSVKTGGGTSSWEIRIPEGIREVIGRRLDRLSDRTNEILTFAAVVGREFSLDTLRELADDTTEGQMLDILDEALESRLIEELPHEVGRFQFAHALVQETLQAELSSARKVRLHARIAEALENIYDLHSDEHAAELVPHFLEAEPVLGVEKLIHYSILAGEQALALTAPERAETYFEQALANTQSDKVDDQIARLSLGLGRARGHVAQFLPDYQAAFDSLRSAFEYYAATNDRELVAEIVMEPSLTRMPIEGAVQLLDSAASQMDSGSASEAAIQARLTTALLMTGDAAAARASLERTESVVATLQDPKIHKDMLMSKFLLVYSGGSVADLTKGLEVLDSLLELLRSHPDPVMESVVAYWRMSTGLRLGKLEETLLEAEEAYEIASTRRVRWAINFICYAAMDSTSAAGRWDEAESWRLRLAGLSGSAGKLRDGIFRDPAQGVESYPDRLQLIETRLPLAAFFSITHSATVQHVVVDAGLEEDLDQAWTKAGECYSQFADNPFMFVAADISRGMFAAALKREDLAPTAYLRLSNSNGLLSDGLSVDRVLGLLAALMGEIEKAKSHFEDALVFCRNSGYLRELGWACSDYADTLLERGDSADHQQATELQDEAIAIATELGMKPLLERVLAQREILKG